MRHAWRLVGELAALGALEWVGVALWWRADPAGLAMAALQVSEWLGW